MYAYVQVLILNFLLSGSVYIYMYMYTCVVFKTINRGLRFVLKKDLLLIIYKL